MLAENEVTIGIILRPHGLRGWVKVRPMTDDPNRYFDLAKVSLHHKDRRIGEYRLERVEMSKPHNLLVKFREFASIEEVETLRDAEIRIPRSECLPTTADQFYHFDLIGLAVQTSEGHVLGTVSEILEHPGNDIWVVHDDQHREMLLPAITSVIKEVNLEEKRIVINLLPGLLDDAKNTT